MSATECVIYLEPPPEDWLRERANTCGAITFVNHRYELFLDMTLDFLF